jgi:hypothetical protein
MMLQVLPAVNFISLHPSNPDVYTFTAGVSKCPQLFSLLHRACCFDYFFNIPTHAPITYTLQSTTYTLEPLKHLKFAPTCFGPFFRPSSGGSWTVLYAVMRPYTAQIHNERTSTDLNLVTAQSTVHETPEDGLKMDRNM